MERDLFDLDIFDESTKDDSLDSLSKEEKAAIVEGVLEYLEEKKGKRKKAKKDDECGGDCDDKKKKADLLDEKITEAAGEIPEKPTAKPWDLSSVTVPGGDGETPKSKPYDAANISIPAGKEISDKVYNDALTRLQKSYKENSDMMFDLLRKAT